MPAGTRNLPRGDAGVDGAARPGLTGGQWLQNSLKLTPHPPHFKGTTLKYCRGCCQGYSLACQIYSHTHLDIVCCIFQLKDKLHLFPVGHVYFNVCTTIYSERKNNTLPDQIPNPNKIRFPH